MERAQGGKIILVRHGETEANRRRHFAESDEIPLTETGRLQARQLALHLAREFRPAVLLSSCFLRARETSEIIANSLDLETEVIAGIHERDFGCLRGHPYERMAEKMSLDSRYDPFQAWMWKPEGGESQETSGCARAPYSIPCVSPTRNSRWLWFVTAPSSRPYAPT